MKYFTDYKVHKQAKIGITNPIRRIAQTKNSHAAAWPALIKAQLHFAGYKNVDILHTSETCWGGYDVILLEHGMEFKGSFNIFGGENNEHVPEQLKRLIRFEGQILSIDIPMPRYYELANKRFAKNFTFNQLALLEQSYNYFDRVSECDTLYLGDSHILSVAMPHGEVCRLDGQTLFGLLHYGLEQYLRSSEYENLILYFGNIDIRHHLMRFAQPDLELAKLLTRYLDALKLLKVTYPQVQVHLVAPLWIEDESRKIPKSGWYKGTPFTGTWAERDRLRDTMTTTMQSWPYPLKTWPLVSLVDSNHKLLFDVMEGKSSVHLSPEYYQPYDPIKF